MFVFAGAAPAEAVIVEGTVREAGTRRAIPGAIVFADTPPVETITDEEGTFRLDLGEVPKSRIDTPDGVTLVVRSNGYVETQFPVRLLEGRTTVDLYVEVDGDGVGTLVRERRSVADIARGAHHIEEREVNELPGTYGDPAKAIENFPGMGRVVRSQGSLLVRGAQPDETAVYVDDFEIPDLYHFTGSTSVINIPFVESVQLVPGAYSARFGRATGGLVRLKTRKLPNDGFHGFAKFDVIDGGAYVGMPIGDNLAVGASARRSWIDLGRSAQIAVLGATDEIVLVPTYWDYQLKIDFDPAPGHELVGFVFGSGDRELYIRENTAQGAPYRRTVDSDFHRVAFRSKNKLGAGFVNTFNIVGGYERRLRDELWGRSVRSQDGFDLQLRDELRWSNDDVTILGGIDSTARLDFIGFSGEAALQTARSYPELLTDWPAARRDVGLPVYRGTLALFAEGTWEPIKTLYLTPGLRIDGYWYSQQPTLSIEPRFAGSYDLLEGEYGFRMKGAAGMFSRPPSPEEIAAARLAGQELAPQNAIHVQGGFEQQLGLGNSMSATLFGVVRTRQTDKVPTYPVGQRPYSSPVSDTTSGLSYGAEFLLRTGASERFFAWLSYAIARHSRIDGPSDGFSTNVVSYAYPSAVDTSHLLTAVGQAKIGWGFRVGARGRMATGQPFTDVRGSLYDADAGRSVPLYGPKGGARFETFYQLDLRIDWAYVFDWCTLDIYADLVNVLNLRWTEGYVFNHDYSERTPLLGLPTIPSIGFKVTW